MTAAFAAGGDHIVGDPARIEQVDIPGSLPESVMHFVDEVAPPVRVHTDPGLVNRARGGAENRCHMVASSAAHTQQNVHVMVAVLQGSPSEELPLIRAEIRWLVHGASKAGHGDRLSLGRTTGQLEVPQVAASGDGRLEAGCRTRCPQTFASVGIRAVG